VDETINKLFISIKNSNINQQKVVDNPINISEKALNVEKIRISEVSFSYKNKGTFNIGQINFEIEKNSFVGLIGSSGSGKSTLLNMIVGLVKPENGAIYYNDNLDIFYNLKHFYKKIAYVTQEVNIINDSVRNNIAFGLNSEEINNDKLLEVINYAQLDNFIKESEKGLDTVLGDKGSRLSGGQKQRIGIARALYFNPDFIVFDEATSALDSRTEEDFLKIIYNLKNKKTILFATHKNSILKRCDKIIRIYNGKIDILNYSEI
jgi:ABC-type multidrug transport system fused ATPase/permease subunit